MLKPAASIGLAVLCWLLLVGCTADDSATSTRIDAGRTDSGVEDVAVPDQDQSAPDADATLDASQPDATSKLPLRILFIGNSFTGVNGLPTVLAKLAESAQSPVSITVGQHTPGGARWEDHDKDLAVDQLIQQGWDYVVLQDQSQQPWLWWLDGIKPALVSLNDKIAKSGAKTLLFMTWALDATPGTDPTRFEMDMAVNQYYERHADGVGAAVAPVGRAWERALRDPAMILHGADGIHPTERGTYLAACVFYATLTDQSPVGLGSGGLAVTAAEQAQLQQVAWDTHLARQRLQSPAVGTWSLSTSAGMHDFAPSDDLTLGDTLPAGTQFGAKKYAAIPYFPGLNAPQITLSVQAYRPDWSISVPAIYETLVAKAWAYKLTQDQLALVATLYTEQPSPSLSSLSYSVAALSPGWHHFAVTYDGKSFAMWIDAKQVAATAASGNIRYYPISPDNSRYNAISIGTHTVDTALNGDSPAAFFTGALSDLRLFDQALSQSELESL